MYNFPNYFKILCTRVQIGPKSCSIRLTFLLVQEAYIDGEVKLLPFDFRFIRLKLFIYFGTGFQKSWDCLSFHMSKDNFISLLLKASCLFNCPASYVVSINLLFVCCKLEAKNSPRSSLKGKKGTTEQRYQGNTERERYLETECKTMTQDSVRTELPQQQSRHSA